MSGIVGIVSLDGRPVNQELLRRMTDSLAYRGPDRQEIWFDGSVGFGHTLLGTGSGSVREEQPATLNGQVWIVADARLDGRSDLVQQLQRSGQNSLEQANDAELILHAYQAWGESCAEHLLGDFAFAIWDAMRRLLLCARDHFGVKPFYYAEVGAGIVFSNTLDCVRLHPAVGSRLNEHAIGDFLLFGCNYEPTTTTFAEIQRLAPAHTLTCTRGQGTVHLKRYWSLPTNGRIRYQRSDEYIDHFKAIVRTAVEDRLRTGRAGVWMSGGLDSTFVTATARQLLAERGLPFDLRAYTVVYDSLIPDNERYYARVAGEALGVEIGFLVADGARPFEGWDQPDLAMPEPIDDPFLGMRRQQLRQAAAQARVILSGDGGDEILWRSYVMELLGEMPLLELGADVARCLVFHRRRPAAGIRATLKKRFGHVPPRPAFPDWLNSAFADRAGLRERWEKMNSSEPASEHPLRPEAYHRLATAPWPWYFEFQDPGVTRIPAEARYPLLDVRLVAFLLAIPPVPWCVDKQLLRVAMRGRLPDSIRLRRKTGLTGDPLGAQLQRAGNEWLDGFDAAPELANYVDRAAVPPLTHGTDVHEPWLNVRPLCLDYWLRRLHPS